MLDTTIRPADFRLALSAYRGVCSAFRGRSVVGDRAKFYSACHVSYCLFQLGGMAGEW